jgi:hypothetical protein
MAQDNSPLGTLRRHLRRRKLEEQQFRARVRAQNVSNVEGLAALSDAELIATAPGIRTDRHELELSRRLKSAIEELTAETIAARASSDRASARIAWLNVLLVVLTAALLALTVVLAVRS